MPFRVVTAQDLVELLGRRPLHVGDQVLEPQGRHHGSDGLGAWLWGNQDSPLTGAVDDEKGIESTKEFAGQVAMLQRETGESADTISGLLEVLQRTGVSGEEASKAMVKFEKGLMGVEDASQKQLAAGKGVIGVMQD